MPGYPKHRGTSGRKCAVGCHGSLSCVALVNTFANKLDETLGLQVIRSLNTIASVLYARIKTLQIF